MPNLEIHTTRTSRIRKKRIIHQPLHRIAQIPIRHRLEHLPALDRHDAVHVRRAGQLGAAEGLVPTREPAVTVLVDVTPDVFPAVVEGDDEGFAGDFLAEERGDEEGDGGVVDLEGDGAGAVG